MSSSKSSSKSSSPSASPGSTLESEKVTLEYVTVFDKILFSKDWKIHTHFVPKRLLVPTLESDECDSDECTCCDDNSRRVYLCDRCESGKCTLCCNGK